MTTTAEQTEQEAVLKRAQRYINRELSWLAFNERVLQQANDPRHPLLERVRFLAIFSNNLSEFFMVRVGGLMALQEENIPSYSIDGRLPHEQVRAISQRLEPMVEERTRLWETILRPALAEEGIHLLPYPTLDSTDQEYLHRYFHEQIFPLLTPLAVDPGRPFPHISNLSLNLAIELEVAPGKPRFARLKIPAAVPPLLRLPAPESGPPTHRFVWSDEVIRAHLTALFPGVRVLHAYTFRLMRDADQPLAESEISDLMMAMENHLRRRHFGRVVRLEVEEGTPPAIYEMLIENIEASARSLEIVPNPLDFSALFHLVDQVKRPDLKFPSFTPVVAPYFSEREARSIFAVLRERDRLIHHPYDSFEPVISFVEAAAEDPNVVAIKQTLYRVGQNAPIVQALLKARRAGKQVAALVELKARFDEENNIEWAKTLEDEGVHVVYGLLGLKTHCKVSLVVRRERGELRRYVHIGTGNYNASTARLYTDLGLFTARPEVGHEVSHLFNFLTGFANQHDYHTLMVAPVGLRERMLALIEREVAHAQAGRPAQLFFKMNALTDRTMTDALYTASQAGVEVRLIVRGACCLRPGVPGLSERIEVRSVIGRFLEHSRVFYFENGGESEVYIGSVDFMARNLDRRVEVVVSVIEPEQQRYLLHDLLWGTWEDTLNNYRLLPDGSYHPLATQQPATNCHTRFLGR